MLTQQKTLSLFFNLVPEKKNITLRTYSSINEFCQSYVEEQLKFGWSVSPRRVNFWKKKIRFCFNVLYFSLVKNDFPSHRLLSSWLKPSTFSKCFLILKILSTYLLFKLCFTKTDFIFGWKKWILIFHMQNEINGQDLMNQL